MCLHETGRKWKCDWKIGIAGKMHGSVGLHSALAIKRQRKAREDKRRSKERRFSSPHTSQSSLADHTPHPKKIAGRAPPDHRLNTSIGMLHLGVVFLVLGLFLIASGILPEDVVSWREVGWWNELVATGIFATSLGIFLICLNRVISKKEENDLNEYVQTQLTRSRSGHRLERDTETGCLTTKQHRRLLQMKREDIERGLTNEDLPTVHSPTIKDHVINGNAHLEKILEEEPVDKNKEEYRSVDIEIINRETVSTTTTASLSPGSPSETRLLIQDGRQPIITRM